MKYFKLKNIKLISYTQNEIASILKIPLDTKKENKYSDLLLDFYIFNNSKK